MQTHLYISEPDFIWKNRYFPLQKYEFIGRQLTVKKNETLKTSPKNHNILFE